MSHQPLSPTAIQHGLMAEHLRCAAGSIVISTVLRKPTHRGLQLALGLILLGCDGGSIEQACVPHTGRGCETGQICTTSLSGAPVCISSPQNIKAEGAYCEAVRDPTQSNGETAFCGPGLGCVELQGVSRCLRFCDPEGDDGMCGEAGLVTGERHLYASQATCSAAVTQHPGIGLCVLPCPLGRDDMESGCPDGTVCALDRDGYFALCQQPGLQGNGLPCGPSCGCAENLVCHTESDASRCRLVATNESQCNADEGFITPLVGTIDVFSQDNRPYSLCLPCRGIGLFDAFGFPIQACVNTMKCIEEGGRLATLEQHDLSAVSALLNTLFMFSEVRVDVSKGSDGQWSWGSLGGESAVMVADDSWMQQTPPETADCVALKSGELLAGSDCEGNALCVKSQPLACDEVLAQDVSTSPEAMPGD